MRFIGRVLSPGKESPRGAPAPRRNASLDSRRQAGRRLRLPRSVVVEDRAEAAPLLEQRIAAVAGQVQVEGLVRFPPGVALDFDRDRLGRLAGREGQRAGPGDVIV